MGDGDVNNDSFDDFDTAPPRARPSAEAFEATYVLPATQEPPTAQGLQARQDWPVEQIVTVERTPGRRDVLDGASRGERARRSAPARDTAEILSVSNALDVVVPRGATQQRGTAEEALSASSKNLVLAESLPFRRAATDPRTRLDAWVHAALQTQPSSTASTFAPHTEGSEATTALDIATLRAALPFRGQALQERKKLEAWASTQLGGPPSSAPATPVPIEPLQQQPPSQPAAKATHSPPAKAAAVGPPPAAVPAHAVTPALRRAPGAAASAPVAPPLVTAPITPPSEPATIPPATMSPPACGVVPAPEASESTMTMDQYVALRVGVELSKDASRVLKTHGLSKKRYKELRREWSRKALADAALAARIRKKLSSARRARKGTSKR